mgnify:FL=1
MSNAILSVFSFYSVYGAPLSGYGYGAPPPQPGYGYGQPPPQRNNNDMLMGKWKRLLTSCRTGTNLDVHVNEISSLEVFINQSLPAFNAPETSHISHLYHRENNSE